MRGGTFETNSSSSHAIVLMTEREYDLWQNERMYLDISEESENSWPTLIQWPSFVTEDDAKAIFEKSIFGNDEYRGRKSLIECGEVPYNIVELLESGEDVYPIVRAFIVEYKDWCDRDMKQLQVIFER